VRCLPNPFYIDELKKLTGLDEPVRNYVMKWEQAKGLVPKLLDLIDYLVPLYREEGKSQLVVAIGCTGGRHRSVAFAELVYKHLLEEKGMNVSVTHRDIAK
ncbi:MAG: RNase adapter RapZ, partial [Oscillospiraceae bacterium]